MPLCLDACMLFMQCSKIRTFLTYWSHAAGIAKGGFTVLASSIIAKFSNVGVVGVTCTWCE